MGVCLCGAVDAAGERGILHEPVLHDASPVQPGGAHGLGHQARGVACRAAGTPPACARPVRPGEAPS